MTTRGASRAAAAVLAVVVPLVLAGCGSSAITDVNASQFLQVAADPSVTVIDVRTPDEYAAGHLAGAINIDVEAPSFSTDIAELDKNAHYAVYCHSGRRSALASDVMAKAGFLSIHNLKGGLVDLQAAGGQVVTS